MPPYIELSMSVVISLKVCLYFKNCFLALGQSQVVFSFSFCYRNDIRNSLPSHVCHMLCPAHLPLCDRPDHVLYGVQTMNPQNVQVSPSSCHVHPNRPKHSLQRPVLRHFLLSSIYMWGQQYKTVREIIMLYNTFVLTRLSQHPLHC
jgi:hypothetical protein